VAVRPATASVRFPTGTRHCWNGATFSLVDGAPLRRYPVLVVTVNVDLDTIRKNLNSRKARRQEQLEIQRRAAVATILRTVAGETEVLLIRRAERQGDPWSGHMAFPGGHQEPGDADLRATAIRETFEEVGIDLTQHDYLGQLDELPARAGGKFVGMVIAPHVFALRNEPVLRPNAEVAEYVWAPVGQMVRGEVDAIKELSYGGELRRLPAFRVQDHIVWGMTHNMLRSLFEVLDDTVTLEDQATDVTNVLTRG
jgi:8-oxo-dGTP pyrophosphatase MutT (NUDIX family)